ncbi:hypothetical protein CLOM_g15489 [Closterium sp. NIES-68]|nr:hypothetical protein CLOM_g15489 [Closterium sp. NIES-68]GJP81007.1 hypothetical protein CLOP_g11191 [Closterium sp. NIES-67]
MATPPTCSCLPSSATATPLLLPHAADITPRSLRGTRLPAAVASPAAASARRSAVVRASLALPQGVFQPLAVAFQRGPWGASAAETAEEAALVAAVGAAKGRGREVTDEQRQAIQRAVETLEATQGVRGPTQSPLLEGTWELLYTTRPGTASPIQRAFVGVDAFKVFQQISLQPSNARVNNIVVFGDSIGRLKVEAAASVASPSRVAFRFDRAAFQLAFWPYRVPYPVPFRLLGDEAKGWLDTTYLSRSGALRISKGNKGTTFVLRRFVTPQERLLQAIQRRQAGVEQLLAPVAAVNPTHRPASSDLLPGRWRLLWSSQSSEANRVQRLTAGLAKNFQVVSEDGSRLENVVELLPAVLLRAAAEAYAVGPARTEVYIDETTLEVGPLKFNLPITGEGYIDQLYLDETLRVSRGNAGSLFVHVRDS